MDEVLKDERFSHISKDPRFRRMPKGDRKVKIDKRFKDMFKDKKFKLKYTVDSRGRPVNQSTNENLKRFYELSGSESEDSGDSDAESEDEGANEDEVNKRLQKSDSENSSEKESDESNSDNRVSPSKEKVHGKQESSKLTKADKKKAKGKKEKQRNKETEYSGNLANENVMKNVDKTDSVKKKEGKKKKEKSQSKKTDEVVSSDNDEKAVKIKPDKGKKLTKKQQMSEKVLDKEIDYARGEGVLDSSSSDDDSDSDDSLDQDSDDFDHQWNEADDNIEDVTEATYRLALCNMDWDRIKAKDIFFLLSSFKTPHGIIKSVKVYPSKFGKERMEQERQEGPKELKDIKIAAEGQQEGDEEVELGKEDTKFQTEKLRQYQLARLRYYYAVAECDSAATADQIYKECDGKEYESSSTKVDLRFIPDEMEFEDEPTSACTDVPADYKPNFFFNTALSQSKVDLTWDETDRERTHKMSKQFEPTGEDLEDDDLNAYLASSSDEEGPDYGNLIEQSDTDDDEEGDDQEDKAEEAKEDKQISKYKLLLQEIDQEEKKKKDLDVQMEITWEPGLKEATEEIVKKKKEKKDATPWDDYLARKKEKKKQRQMDRKHQRLVQHTAAQPQEQEEDDEEEEDSDGMQGDDAAFSDDELPGSVDMEDPFFAEEDTGTQKTQKADKKKKKKKKQAMKETEEDLKEKEALSLLMLGEEDGKKHFNLKNLVDPDKKKKKKKKDKHGQPPSGKEDDFKMDVQDPRFSAMYDSHLFNIDPSAPEFKKTRGTEAIVEEKLKRNKKKGNKSSQNPHADTNAKKRKLDEGTGAKEESIASLVNSIKMKTKHFKKSKSKV